MIRDNRKLGGTQHSYDVMIGPVANDNTMLTVARYIEGTYTAEEALNRLAYSKVNDQVAFHTEKALRGVHFIRRYTVELPSIRKELPVAGPVGEKYVYHGIDITLDVYEKIGAIAELIADKEKISFEDAYQKFADSKVYEALQNTETVMWSESPEYIVDEYYRQKCDKQNDHVPKWRTQGV